MGGLKMLLFAKNSSEECVVREEPANDESPAYIVTSFTSSYKEYTVYRIRCDCGKWPCPHIMGVIDAELDEELGAGYASIPVFTGIDIPVFVSLTPNRNGALEVRFPDAASPIWGLTGQRPNFAEPPDYTEMMEQDKRHKPPIFSEGSLLGIIAPDDGRKAIGELVRERLTEAAYSHNIASWDGMCRSPYHSGNPWRRVNIFTNPDANAVKEARTKSLFTLITRATCEECWTTRDDIGVPTDV